MDPISFGRLWPETVAAVRRHADLLWPLAAAFLFLPQLLAARHIADRKANQIFVGDALPGDLIAVGLLLLTSTLGQLVMARIIAHEGTEGRTLGAELRTGLARLPAAIAVLLILFVLFVLASSLPAALAFLLGGGNLAGVIAVMVTGIWLASRLGLAIPLLATDDPEPTQAIGSSWRLTRGHSLRIVAMLAILTTGFLLLVLAIGGLGAALGVISTIATGPVDSGWGIGRWLFELSNAAVSAAIGTFYIGFLTRLAVALKDAERTG